MILSFVSWSGAFNIDLFDDVTSAVTGFKLFVNIIPFLLMLYSFFINLLMYEIFA